MSLLVDNPIAVQDTPERREAMLAARDERRAKGLGLLLTLIIWPLLVWLFAWSMRVLGESHSAKPGDFTRPKPVFDIEMEPDSFILPQKPAQPDRFVEANPDAPENTPDNTRNFSDRNQQVAQETPDPNGRSDMPKTEGKKDTESNQIVSGSLTQPETTEPPPPPPSPELMQAAQAAAQQQERNPLSGEEKILGESDSEYGFNLGDRTKKADATADEKVEGAPDVAPLINGAAQAAVARIDPQRPMERPRLEKKVRPAVLVERAEGTSNIGPIALDARWSEYGQYLRRLIDTVQIEWERILQTSKSYPPPGSTAVVKFRIGATEGAILEVIHSESTGGNSFERACISAITNRSPYGAWTDDMKTVLGESQEMTFQFYIQ